MATLDQNILDQIPVHRFDTEQAICDELKSQGGGPLDSSPKWLFRGQVSRRPRRKWPPVEEDNVKKHALELEQLLPTDYRKLEERLEANEARPGLEPIYGDRIAGIRSLTATYLMQCHSHWGDQDVQDWYEGLAGTDLADKLLSIGQHYGMLTHFLDLTSDWRVALWFATHKWSGDYIPGGDGVIYQFRLKELCCAEKAANDALAIKNPKEQFRHVDIRDTPAILAPRARAQRGFSLISVESPHLVQAMIQKKAIKVLVFPRGAQPSPDNSLTRDLLAPPIDEMAVLFDECKGGKRWSDVVTWLGQPGYGLSTSNLDHQHLFA